VQGTVGAGTGFVIGTGSALLDGESLGDALKAGGKSALTSAAISTANGIAIGMRSAYKVKENAWTGNPKVTANDLGVSSTMDRIKAGESNAHRNDGTTFRNDKKSLPVREHGYYKEYVHPTPGVNGPGLQRIIIGGDKYYYYSPDHYKTFIRFDL